MTVLAKSRANTVTYDQKNPPIGGTCSDEVWEDDTEAL